MASLRKIVVKDIPYLQAVEYEGGKTKVLKAFGRESEETKLEALQFIDSYNRLTDELKKEKNKERLKKVLKAASLVFGGVLGYKIFNELEKRYLDK